MYVHPEILLIKESSNIKPSNPYVLSKRLAEEVCEFYSGVHGLDIPVIKPFNANGAEQDETFLIPVIIRQVLTEAEIAVQDLLPKKDYVFWDDLVEALLVTIKPSKGYSIYNVDSGYLLSVDEVISIIQEVAEVKKEVLSNNNVRANELMDVLAGISEGPMPLLFSL